MDLRKKMIVRALCIAIVLSCALSEVSGQAILVIYSNVTGFEVWFDGMHIYTTPPDKDYCWLYNVYLGTHTITLRKSGCADVSTTINITSSSTYEITINMSCGNGGSGGSGGSGGNETKDSDKDGVPDDKDNCYNRDCNVVDSRGCPKDSDSDNVSDCDDDCPFEKGVSSNDGCPVDPGDKDNDGITDDRDSCYNVGCTIVDSRGCPKDSDSDGVTDCDDDCKYDKGPAYNDGCPEKPGDKDNDGITDNRDSCYNVGCTIVDSRGCPKDSDSDGVTDCDDDCRYDKGPASLNGCPEDYKTNIFKYWWVIAVLISVLGVVLLLNYRRPQKLKM